jgi:hypothetical protein
MQKGSYPMSRLTNFVIALVVSVLGESRSFAVYNADLGRWISRDPVGYVDGPNLFGYAGGNPIVALDSHGLTCHSTNCEPPAGTQPANRMPPTDCVMPLPPDQHGPPSPDQQVCAKLCASGALGAASCHPNERGKMICCNCVYVVISQALYQCPFVEKLSDALEACERIHFTHLDCTLPPPIDPGLGYGLVTGSQEEAVSECDVHKCMLHRFRCSGNPVDDPEDPNTCLGACLEQYRKIENKKNEWCGKVGQATMIAP